jgi:hypothetical protein
MMLKAIAHDGSNKHYFILHTRTIYLLLIDALCQWATVRYATSSSTKSRRYRPVAQKVL